ncbi:MAG: sulfatase [bacterium]
MPAPTSKTPVGKLLFSVFAAVCLWAGTVTLVFPADLISKEAPDGFVTSDASAVSAPKVKSGITVSGRRPNVIIISMDCLRADHIGSYGYNRNTSPSIDRLAGSGIRFSQAIAQASSSQMSAVSLLTGHYGVPGAVPKWPSSAITLGEAFRMSGYRTAAFTGSVHLSRRQGFNRGFDDFYNEMEYGRLKDILRHALTWLERRGDGEFLLFLQAYDAHAPYEMPEKYRHLFEKSYDGILNRFGMGHALGRLIKGNLLTTEYGMTYRLGPKDFSHWNAQYDGAITYADKQIGDFLGYLDRTGLADNTIVVFLGSHGEALGKRGFVLPRRHGDIYEEGIHVPLIIRLPEQFSKLRFGTHRPLSVIDTQVQLIDLMPTILDLLDIPVPRQCQGKSLTPLMEGSALSDFNRFVFSVGAGGDSLTMRSCVRSGGWKLLRFRNKAGSLKRKELYNLTADPGERKNLVGAEPGIERSLATELERFDAARTSALRTNTDAKPPLKAGRSPDSDDHNGIYRPNILMIVMESGRPDHFSYNGYRLPTTPNIDALARRSAVFKSAYAQSNWTLPSFASLLTGKYPRSLGMFTPARKLSDFPYTDPPLRRTETTLPEALKKAGYRTAGFFTGRFNAAAYGFDKGFDIYRNYQRKIDKDRKPMKSFPDFLPEAMRWMEKEDNSPFFVLLNPSETHRPYLPPKSWLQPYVKDYAGSFDSIWLSKKVFSGIRKDDKGWFLSRDDVPAEKRLTRLGREDIDYLTGRYDSALAYSDKFIGDIMEWLQQRLLFDTIVVLTSDHGEQLGDHGAFLHCTEPPRLYREVTHVPLIIKTPKLWLNTGGTVIEQDVGLIDVMPTLLDLVRVHLPEGMQGRSLLGHLLPAHEPLADRPVFAETSGHGTDVQSIQSKDWKLIVSRQAGGKETVELYRISSDPGETRNVARETPAVVQEMKNRLAVWTAVNEKSHARASMKEPLLPISVFLGIFKQRIRDFFR